MKFLTVEEHREVVVRLVSLAETMKELSCHSAGWTYTAVMAGLFGHSVVSAQSVLRLGHAFPEGWYPASVGMNIARSMFEVDITAHYITNDPEKRAEQYVKFGSILRKRGMDACLRYRNSTDTSWKTTMAMEYEHHWRHIECDVNVDYAHVCASGIKSDYRSWSGKSIKQMAREVDHLEAYDIFYADLSAIAHVSVPLITDFLQKGIDGVRTITTRSSEGNVGNVYRYTATFFTCLLELFGKQFAVWSDEDVSQCWEVEQRTHEL